MERNKVFFVQKNGDDEFETESLWCIVKNDTFIIDNIPFIMQNVALGDVIIAEFDQENGAYYFDKFVARSGNSTVRLYFEDADLIEEIRKQLLKFNCESECFLERKIVAVNIPCAIYYPPLKKYLETGEENNLWMYEESCLSHEYIGLV
jgi:hypothetical protein